MVPSFLRPIHHLHSRPALRAYLTTILLTLSTALLLFLAITSYALFYLHHVPHLGVCKPLHLQFPTSPTSPPPHPTGTIHFRGEIVPRTEYTVTLRLHLPVSPANADVGNFMADIAVYSTAPGAPAPLLVASGRRSGLVPWRSGVARALMAIRRAPAALLLSRGAREEEVVEVVLLEELVLDESARHAVVTLESRSRLDVYEARVEFAARLSGVRWVMWRWRAVSFLLGVGVFFCVEVLAMAVVWWGVYNYFSAPSRGLASGGGSDDEGEAEVDVGIATPESLEGEVEADDEDDGGDEEVLFRRALVPKSDVGDSGLGSLSESVGTGRESGAGASTRRRIRLD